MNIEQLPDYPALSQLATSLWKVGDTKGAAVLVGSGFSRNAIRLSPISPRPPLWNDFRDVLIKALYPTGSPTTDPLRLAEEYRAQFGTPALEGLIRQMVPDDQWEPSALHDVLVELPWNDILTTNWDTLLERSAERVYTCDYSTVHVPADIARTRSPRIVKLHGSLPSYTPFIFAEEDYRTYPTQFSPFVNLVRQVILENDLCLIGFSGDDPNFIQWSGWVRDELGASARRIFLLGALDLTPNRRRYFETRHVTPIDLSPICLGPNCEDPHQFSINVAVQFFRKARPKPLHHWPNEHTATQLRQFEPPPPTSAHPKHKTSLLTSLRESYPGWLLCPAEIRRQLRWMIEPTLRDVLRSLPSLGAGGLAPILYELLWLYDTALIPLDTDLIGPLGSLLGDDAAPELSMSVRCQIAASLLRSARERLDDGAFSTWSAWLASRGAARPDTDAIVAYEECLRARDRLDFESVAANSHRLIGDDPAWALRRASILAEIGDVETAIALYGQAKRELERRLSKDRRSIWITSRLGWASMVSRSLRKFRQAPESADPLDPEGGDWPQQFAESKCDPWDELSAADDAISEELERLREDRKPVIPRFDAGHFVDKSKSLRLIGSPPISSAYGLRRILDGVGLPPTLSHLDFSTSRLIRTLSLDHDRSAATLLWDLRVLTHAKESDLDREFTRMQVLRLSSATVQALVAPIRTAIDFCDRAIQGVAPRQFQILWQRAVPTLLECLSRLTIRFDPSQCQALFFYAADRLSRINRITQPSVKNLGHLLHRSIQGVPIDQRRVLSLEVIRLPLACERECDHHDHGWPELVESIEIDFKDRDLGDERWHARIEQLLNVAQTNRRTSGQSAVLRLTHLHIAGVLTEPEKLALAETLWKSRGLVDGLPDETNLHPYIFLKLPELVSGAAKNAFQKFFTATAVQGPDDLLKSLLAIRGAATFLGGSPLLPTAAQAAALIAELIQWTPLPDDKNSLARHRSFLARGVGDEIGAVMGAVMAEALLPVLDNSPATTDILSKVAVWVEKAQIPSAIEVLPEMVRRDPSRTLWAENLLRPALGKRQVSVLAPALNTVARWIALGPPSAAFALPTTTSHHIVGIVANRRHPLLALAIYVAQLLVSNGYLDDNQMAILADAMYDLWAETSYDDWDETSLETHSLSLIRKNCVRLCRALQKAGSGDIRLRQLVLESLQDADYEVRLA